MQQIEFTNLRPVLPLLEYKDLNIYSMFTLSQHTIRIFFKIIYFGNIFLYSYQIEVKCNWVLKDVASVLGKCTKLSAQIANKNVKFLLNLPQDGQSIVENAIQSISDSNY